MSPLILSFGAGVIVGAGVMAGATLLAAILMGIGVRIEDLLQMESDPGLLASIVGMLMVFLFLLVATQTNYLDNACLVRYATTCWPGGN